LSVGARAGCQDVSDPVNGQEVGQRLGGEPPPRRAGGRQLGIHRQHRGPELREVQGVERRGLIVAADLGPQEITRRYLTRDDGTRLGDAAWYLAVCVARVPEKGAERP
jgi:hypothetical protein